MGDSSKVTQQATRAQVSWSQDMFLCINLTACSQKEGNKGGEEEGKEEKEAEQKGRKRGDIKERGSKTLHFSCGVYETSPLILSLLLPLFLPDTTKWAPGCAVGKHCRVTSFQGC